MKNVKFKFILILISFLLLTELKAQENNYNNLPDISIGAGYFGELLTHPGFNLNSEFALNKDKIQMLARISLINYKHNYHTKTWMLMQEVLLRKNTKNFNYWETSLGTAYIYQKAEASLYEYNNSEFSESNSGRFSIAPTFGIRYGYSIKLPNGGMIIPNIGGRVSYQYPLDDFNLFRAAIDFSTSYKLK